MFFLGKKTDSTMTNVAQLRRSHPPQPLQVQVEELQAEVRLLHKRLISMGAKVPSVVPPPADSPIVAATPTVMPLSKGEGEVFFKDGKKYRRVVRKVRPTNNVGASPPEGSRSSSFQSSEHGTESVPERHVDAIRARSAMNSVATEVSNASTSSCGSRMRYSDQNPAIRIREYPYSTPTQNEQKTTENKAAWMGRPSPISSEPVADNPWVQKDMKKTPHPENLGSMSHVSIPPKAIRESPQHIRVVDRNDKMAKNEQSPFATSRNVKIIPSGSPYTKTSSEMRALPYLESFSSPIDTPQGHESKTPTGIRHLINQKKGPLSGHLQQPTGDANNHKDSVTRLPESDKSSGSINRWNPMAKKTCEKPSVIALKPPPRNANRSDALLQQIQAKHGNYKSTSNKLVEKTGRSPPSQYRGGLNQTKAKKMLPGKKGPVKPSNRANNENSSFPPIGSTQSACLLDQIRKRDVQLKKIEPLQERATMFSNSQQGASNRTDRLTGSRAGVPFKSVKNSAFQEPKKQYDSPMSELMAKIQEKKAERMRKECVGRDEIDW